MGCAVAAPLLWVAAVTTHHQQCPPPPVPQTCWAPPTSGPMAPRPSLTAARLESSGWLPRWSDEVGVVAAAARIDAFRAASVCAAPSLVHQEVHQDSVCAPVVDTAPKLFGGAL